MKFQVSMKCPDAVDDAIAEAAQDEDEKMDAKRAAEKWFKYGEYLTVQIDTDAGTATVLPV